MPAKILDDYTDLNVSRQRKWQLRRAREGRCIKCGALAVADNMCLKDRVKFALYQHRQRSSGPPLTNSKWLRLTGLVALEEKTERPERNPKTKTRLVAPITLADEGVFHRLIYK